MVYLVLTCIGIHYDSKKSYLTYPYTTTSSFCKEIGSQTNDYDLTKMALSGRHEHKVWRDEVGGPFLEVIIIFLSVKYSNEPLSTRVVNR